jgi:hypothetical protein
MEHVILNAETGETTVIPFTAEEEAEFLTRANQAPPAPTLGELQAQLAVLTAQMAALANTG